MGALTLLLGQIVRSRTLESSLTVKREVITAGKCYYELKALFSDRCCYGRVKHFHNNNKMIWACMADYIILYI